MRDHTPIPDGFKRCSKGEQCAHSEGPVLPATKQYFYSHKGLAHGLSAQCKACVDIANKAYKLANPERTKRNRRNWNRSHPDKVKPALQAWKAKNKDHRRAYARQYRAEHGTPWFDKHPDIRKQYAHSRRAKQLALAVSFTADDWQRALDYFGNCCAVCDRPRGLWHTLAQDHWIPLSKGGSYTPGNIVPLCHGIDGCNNNKFDKIPGEWLTERFGARKAKQIAARIEAYFESMRQS